MYVHVPCVCTAAPHPTLSLTLLQSSALLLPSKNKSPHQTMVGVYFRNNGKHVSKQRKLALVVHRSRVWPTHKLCSVQQPLHSTSPHQHGTQVTAKRFKGQLTPTVGGNQNIGPWVVFRLPFLDVIGRMKPSVRQFGIDKHNQWVALFLVFQQHRVLFFKPTKKQQPMGQYRRGK